MLFLGSIALLLVLVAEGVLRSSLHRGDARLAARMQELDGSRLNLPGNIRDFANIIRLSRNPGIIYELIPNLSVTFQDAPVETNAAGFRGPWVPVERSVGTVRILGLGDSLMFGWGVSEGETYLDGLRQRLNARHPAVTWEIVNTAVPGYNTVMEVELLKDRGLRYEPDFVLIHFVDNDLSLPNFIRRRRHPWTLSKFFLADAVRGRLENLDVVQDERWKSVFAGAPRPSSRFESDPDRVPPEYRNHVGPEAYVRAMTELRDLGDEHDFGVCMVGLPRVSDLAAETARELGIAVDTTVAELRAFIAFEGLEGPLDPRLYVSETDRHPSALAHRFAAEVFYRKLRDQGVIDDLIAHARDRA